MKKLFGPLTIAALIGLLLIPGLLYGQTQRRLRIAIQPGIGYAHLIVMRDLKMLERHLPGLQVEWLRLTSGPVIRDAMLAGQVDIGSGGVGPFIIAWDRGVKWKIVSALNQMPLYLNTNRDGVRTIKDLTPADKIAMPAVGSIQHVVLQMAAEKEFGNAHALDQLIVSMAHPDAMFALMSKREITGHLTSPPFQYLELQITGIRKVFDSYQVVGGPHTFNLVWAMEDFPRRNPEVYQAFLRALDEAQAYLIDHRDDAARILAETENTQPGFMRALLRNPELQYTTTPHRLMQFAGFLKKTNQIKQAPASWKDFAFENMHRLPGD